MKVFVLRLFCCTVGAIAIVILAVCTVTNMSPRQLLGRVLGPDATGATFVLRQPLVRPPCSSTASDTWSFEEPVIGSMSGTAAAYTEPWAMWEDKSGQFWLNPDYDADSSAGGTVSMCVQRGIGNDFTAWIKVGDFGAQYTPEARPDYSGQPNLHGLPVVRIIIYG